MDEKEADQLWRELADTDRAAKRGFVRFTASSNREYMCVIDN